jgi:beta-phosphoglucomutase
MACAVFETPQPKSCKVAIFYLDSIGLDVARYHYEAWKMLAAELGFISSEQDNERLRGVSRMQSLEIPLEGGNQRFSEAEMLPLPERKKCLSC